MTKAQLEAFKEISQNGERFTIPYLRIRKTTEKAMLSRGWIMEDCDKYFITEAGYAALDKAGYAALDKAGYAALDKAGY